MCRKVAHPTEASLKHVRPGRVAHLVQQCIVSCSIPLHLHVDMDATARQGTSCNNYQAWKNAALAGAPLIQLYTQWKSKSPFPLVQPSPDKLKAVASEFTQRQEWKSALSVGHDLAKSQPSLAADIACTLMQKMPRQSSDYKLVFQTLPWLQAAKRHEEVIEVSNSAGQLTAPEKHGKNNLVQHSSQHVRSYEMNNSSLCLTTRFKRLISLPHCRVFPHRFSD